MLHLERRKKSNGFIFALIHHRGLIPIMYVTTYLPLTSLPGGIPCPFSSPRGLDGVMQSILGSLRRTKSMSTALKKATDCII